MGRARQSVNDGRMLAREDADAENAFIEQAEYISEDEFLAWNAEHPEEEAIIRRLSAGGAKLLSGPRGCGKTTLLLKAYYGMLRSEEPVAFPVYANFKLSLRLEPLYLRTNNASFWFRHWLIAKIYEAVYDTLEDFSIEYDDDRFPRKSQVKEYIRDLESGTAKETEDDYYSVSALETSLIALAELIDCTRCVLLLDDAAHAFSPKQQEDFFDFFREIKSREIAPKAAIYPGITTHSPSFHVGHDAELIDAWIRPDTSEYLDFMISLATKRFSGMLPLSIDATNEAIEFLAFAAFGIPRSFLNMIRSLHLEEDNRTSIDRRKLLHAAKLGREAAHNVYESLVFKLPVYKNFIQRGETAYARILSSMKFYNGQRDEENQAFEIGIKKPIPPDLAKVLSFFQYAGLLLPVGENSRGIKGVFELYIVHFGDLITENAVIGKRTKSVASFLGAFKSQTHQAWPRIAPIRLLGIEGESVEITLSLPNCQRCGAPRLNENARFCQNCGAQLKTSSLYDALVLQDISALPITKRRANAIKANSNIRTIKDILIDSSRQELRGVPYIGKIWAERIAHYAEEHVA